MSHTDLQTIDDILLSFAKRVENMQRGKTYGWTDEKQAIEALISRRERTARIRELETLYWNSEISDEVKDYLLPYIKSRIAIATLAQLQHPITE